MRISHWETDRSSERKGSWRKLPINLRLLINCKIARFQPSANLATEHRAKGVRPLKLSDLTRFKITEINKNRISCLPKLLGQKSLFGFEKFWPIDYQRLLAGLTCKKFVRSCSPSLELDEWHQIVCFKWKSLEGENIPTVNSMNINWKVFSRKSFDGHRQRPLKA